MLYYVYHVPVKFAGLSISREREKKGNLYLNALSLLFLEGSARRANLRYHMEDRIPEVFTAKPADYENDKTITRGHRHPAAEAHYDEVKRMLTEVYFCAEEVYCRHHLSGF